MAGARIPETLASAIALQGISPIAQRTIRYFNFSLGLSTMCSTNSEWYVPVILRAQSGINIIFSNDLPALKTKLTMRFTNQPVDQAVYLAADMAGLNCLRFRNTLYVCPQGTAQRFEDEFERLSRRQVGAQGRGVK